MAQGGNIRIIYAVSSLPVGRRKLLFSSQKQTSQVA